MNKAISAKQLAYSIGAFIFASSLLTSNLYHFAKHDSWAPVILGYGASLIIIGIYIALSKRYPGLDLIDINKAVFGRFGGKAVSALYIFYFVSLACFNTRDLGDFIKGAVLPSTPIMLVFAIFVFLCAWSTRKGAVNMTRYGFFSVLVVVVAIVMNGLFLLNRIDLKTLLPALTLPIKDYLIGAHIVTMLPFCEILAFMMFIPYMYRPEKFGNAMRKGLTIGAAMLLLIVFRDITVLGEFVSIFSMPTFSVIRYIDIADILTRLEIIYAIILIGLLFFKASVIYFAVISGLSKLLRFDSYQALVSVVGVFVVIYAAASFSSVAEHVYWNHTAAATYSTFFILVLPLVTLVVSHARGGGMPQPVPAAKG